MGAVDKYVMGDDFTLWFVGVVESRQDPLAVGRVQVRAYVTHTASLTDIPSADLPWAIILQPTTASPPWDIKEGDTVLGLWADGPNKQTPIILGKLPGFVVNPAKQGQGFSDQRTPALLQNAPQPTASLTYASDGSGVTVTNNSSAVLNPLPDQLGLPTFSGASRYDIANTVIQYRIDNLDSNIVTAQGITWSEPYPAYNPLAPYNKAYQSESGHIIEVDDTIGNERLAWTHRSGSFREMYPSGSVVEKATRSKYSIVMGDDYVHVMGRTLVTVSEGAYVRIIGDAYIECDNDLNVGVAGDVNWSVGGAFNVNAASLNMATGGDATVVADDIYLTSQGDVDVDASGNFNAEGNQVNITGEQAAISADLISLDGQTLATNINQGPSSAGPAASGSAATVPTAPSQQQPNTGQAPEEQVPVPWPQNFANLSSFAALSYKQQQFLVTTTTNTSTGIVVSMTAPDANAPNVPCSFDANVHTFLPSSQWAISQNGLMAIQQREGYATALANGSCQAYPDPVLGPSLLTIGYGTTSCVLPASDALTSGTIITQAVAQQYLLDAINTIFLPGIQRYVSVELTQGMIDALISFVYNIGLSNFARSSVLRYTNQSNWCAAYNSFALWNKSGGQVVAGLTARRAAEAAQYVS